MTTSIVAVIGSAGLEGRHLAHPSGVGLADPPLGGPRTLVLRQRGGDGAHEPGVDGQPLAGGGLLDALLEALGQAEVDAGGRGLVDLGRLGAGSAGSAAGGWATTNSGSPARRRSSTEPGASSRVISSAAADSASSSIRRTADCSGAVRRSVSAKASPPRRRLGQLALQVFTYDGTSMHQYDTMMVSSSTPLRLPRRSDCGPPGGVIRARGPVTLDGMWSHWATGTATPLRGRSGWRRRSCCSSRDGSPAWRSEDVLRDAAAPSSPSTRAARRTGWRSSWPRNPHATVARGRGRAARAARRPGRRPCAALGLRAAVAGTHPLVRCRGGRGLARRALPVPARSRCASWRGASRRSRCTCTSRCPTPSWPCGRCNGMRAHVPVLLALSANSPFTRGARQRPGLGPHAGLPGVPAHRHPARDGSLCRVRRGHRHADALRRDPGADLHLVGREVAAESSGRWKCG